MAMCENSGKPSAEDTSKMNPILETKFKPFDIDGKQWFLPVLWEKQGEGFRNFKSRPSDIWIMSQPRSGTTLTQELVWLLMNNMDFENAKKFHLSHRSIELCVSLFPLMWQQCKLIQPSKENPNVFESIPVDTSKTSYEVYADVPPPRIIKTHFSFSVHKDILESGCKLIYVLRNPKDMLVSRARLATSGPYPFCTDSLPSYIRHFIEEYPEYSPQFGPYWQHVKEGWAKRNHPNVLLIYYEELRIDLPAAIKKIAAFLGKSYTEEEVKKLAAHLDIDTFRKNPMVNELPSCENTLPTFIGKGHVKGWSEVITPEIEADVDRWMEENTKDSDIVFPYL